MSIEDQVRRVARELRLIREALERMSPPPDEPEPPRTFVTSRRW